MNQQSFHFPAEDAARTPAPGAAPAADLADAPPRPVPFTVMGFSLSALILLLLLLMPLAWGTWATREILELRERKIVSVSLTAMMKAFVTAEARRPQSPDSARTRTLAFLQSVETSIDFLASEGHVVLLSEAVAGNSVPDYTPEVMAIVASRMQRLPATDETPDSEAREGSGAGEGSGASQEWPE